MRICNRYALAVALALVAMASSSQAAPISVDFIYNGLSGGDGSGVTAPCSGDTTLGAGNVQNTNGQIFTGQAGPWNAIIIGGNGATMTTASSGVLVNGAGATTTARLLMGTAANPSASGNQWGNTFIIPAPVGGGGGRLRMETAYLFDGEITGPSYDWALTGLNPSSEYRLTFFGKSGGLSNVANGVPAVMDADNDWDWTSVYSDAGGRISGLFTAGIQELPGLTGLQIEALDTQVDNTIPEPLTLALLGFGAAGLGGYIRRRRTA